MKGIQRSQTTPPVSQTKEVSVSHVGGEQYTGGLSDYGTLCLISLLESNYRTFGPALCPIASFT